ncbi:MAG: hypothetical protein IPF46_16130 [Saprospiraceae bacterium]|nr:hypothetical protein [Candidatus Vicinibacter affinis]
MEDIVKVGTCHNAFVTTTPTCHFADRWPTMMCGVMSVSLGEELGMGTVDSINFFEIGSAAEVWRKIFSFKGGASSIWRDIKTYRNYPTPPQMKEQRGCLF